MYALNFNVYGNCYWNIALMTKMKLNEKKKRIRDIDDNESEACHETALKSHRNAVVHASIDDMKVNICRCGAIVHTDKLCDREKVGHQLVF